MRGHYMPTDVSVIVATYRRQASLIEAVKSVLDQRGVRLEVLVVDDCPLGSAESTVLGIGDPRLRYVRNPQPSNGRPAIARNVGWPLTSGEIIHFMDDDDLVPEGVYAAALTEFDRSPNIGIVFGRIEAFGEPSQALQNDQALFVRSARRASRLQRLGSARAFAAHLLFHELLFIGGCSLIRRRCVAAVGGYPTGVELMEDVDFLARTTRLFGAKYLDRVSLRYRVWPSLMHRPGNLQEIIDRCYVRIHADYRRAFGAIDFYTLKIAARTILRFL
jgi:glycosyltransferase involved in cell wall biosynthesis